MAVESPKTRTSQERLCVVEEEVGAAESDEGGDGEERQKEDEQGVEHDGVETGLCRVGDGVVAGKFKCGLGEL
jgi:hypothetical protein